MKSVTIVAALCGLFVGSHMLLGARRVREALIARLDQVGFSVLFSLVAWVSFGALAVYYAAHRFDGPQGLGLASVTAVRWFAIGLASFGACLGLSIVAPSGYSDSPMALFTRKVRDPYGLERITRHPFFAGAVMLSAAHILLASRLVGVLFFAAFGLLAGAGAVLQDRRLLARKGEAYAAFLRNSSAIPFLAIVAGRQRIAWSELPWPFIVGSILLIWGITALHNSGFSYFAELTIAVLIIGPSVMTAMSWYRNSRKPRSQNVA